MRHDAGDDEVQVDEPTTVEVEDELEDWRPQGRNVVWLEGGLVRGRLVLKDEYETEAGLIWQTTEELDELMLERRGEIVALEQDLERERKRRIEIEQREG